MKGSSQNSIYMVNQYPFAIGLSQSNFPQFTVLKHLVSSVNNSIIEETAQSGMSLM